MSPTRSFKSAILAFVLGALIGLAPAVGPALADTYSYSGSPLSYTYRELAPGVWAAQRMNSPRIPVVGNTVFVIGDEGVIVFDGGGSPTLAEDVIAKIRSLTDKPVTHVIISHWHGDHNLGDYKFQEAFPNVQIIGHSFTRAAMLGAPMGGAREYPTQAADLTAQIKDLMAKGQIAGGGPLTGADRIRYQDFLDHAAELDADFKAVKVTPPNVTFDDQLTIYSGSREVQVLFLGVGNTEGDAVMWLPKDKIMASGDIVVLPTPYAYNIYPEKWANTLRALNRFDFTYLVPGHGDVQTDHAYVNLLIELMDSVTAQTKALIAQGLDAEQVAAKLDFSAFEDRFTHGDPMLIGRFKVWATDALRQCAYRAEKGETLVVLEPAENSSSDGN
jgi:glyoxylase-like metal-dependent hydrolase (beta-lactamase superfamily II)